MREKFEEVIRASCKVTEITMAGTDSLSENVNGRFKC
jgi:hypothetical protein